MISQSFLNPINPLTHMSTVKCQPISNICGCNERVIYARYLIGLRKTRRILTNATNVNAIVGIMNFTNEFVSNYSTVLPINSTSFNNSEAGVKNIIMGNIVLDVTNVKQIHISTKKDKIIIELDKKQNNIFAIINNIDTYISTLALLGKIMNIN